MFCATDAARQAGRETGKRKGESVLITISHLTKIFEGKGPRVTALEETIVRLLEALQYTLTNLSRENFNPAALERLRAELRNARMENEFLKKAAAYFAREQK